jgi:hypothetical protein
MKIDMYQWRVASSYLYGLRDEYGDLSQEGPLPHRDRLNDQLLPRRSRMSIQRGRPAQRAQSSGAYRFLSLHSSQPGSSSTLSAMEKPVIIAVDDDPAVVGAVARDLRNARAPSTMSKGSSGYLAKLWKCPARCNFCSKSAGLLERRPSKTHEDPFPSFQAFLALGARGSRHS